MIALAVALQANYYLAFKPGDVLRFAERFVLTEVSSNARSTAEGSREQTLVIKKLDRGRATMDLKLSEPTVSGSGADGNDLAAELRSWLDREAGEQVVNTRGFLERKGFPSGTRPYFGFNVPAHRDALPAEWKIKMLPPVGSDKTLEFRYSPLNEGGAPAITFSASAKDADRSIKCDGTVRFADGQVVSSRITTVITEDGTTLQVEYTATRRQG